jgi:hypothetical protein
MPQHRRARRHQHWAVTRQCSTLCDCGAVCHELHQPVDQREHDPASCVALR